MAKALRVCELAATPPCEGRPSLYQIRDTHDYRD